MKTKLAPILLASKNIPPTYVVYDHPRDYPHSFVCRIWYGEEVAEADPFMVAATLDEIRDALELLGLVNLGRFAEDDPVIAEVWL